jgi:alpha-glucosidase/alpha-D-xyloside xylohydrolase
MKKVEAQLDHIDFVQNLTRLCLVLVVCSPAVTASPIRFEGVPVELTISQISDCTVRLQLLPLDDQGQPRAEAVSPALISFPTTEKLQARELDGATELHVGQMNLTIKPSPFTISVHRSDGTLVQELTFASDDTTNAVAFRTAAPVLGLGEGGPQFDRREHFYPMQNGERTPTLAVDGARVQVPFLIGTEGWAMLVSAPLGEFDLRNGQGKFHPREGAITGQADVFITDGREPTKTMREFVRLTGTPVMPPKWALGYMQSHRTLSNEVAILAEARTFRQKQLPCDALIFLGTGFCPAGWNLGHDSFEFNTNVFTHDPATVINELHAEHFQVVLHVVPLRKDYPALHGQIPMLSGETPEAQDIAAYWNRHRALFKAGVDGWWPDEGDWLDVPSRLERHRMYYEGPLNDRPNVRPWNLQRNGYAGIARYGGWIWSGDISSNWRTLAAQVAVGLNSSLSVSPFWGTDIGGFYPVADQEYTGELYARWFQFAAFCPSFRSHGRTWHLHLPWGWDTGETGPVESKPAPDSSELHNAAVEPVCRKYLDLRYRLMPYTYTLAREAHDTGLPMMRALWLQYSDDPQAVALGDEYLWGSDLLIAPVLEKGAATRRVYLPAGTWFDWWTGEKHSGRAWVERPVNLETMPIYVRAGAIIPLDPVRQYVVQPVTEPTVLQVYSGKDSNFTLYDDDGQSLAYLNSNDPAVVWIRFHWNDQKRQLTIEPDSRMKKWPNNERAYQVQVIGSGAKPKSVKFNGTPTTVDF